MSDSSPTLALFPLIAVLILVAFGVGLQVYIRGRQVNPVRSTASRILSALWLLPVVILTAVLMLRAIDVLRGGPGELAPPDTAEFVAAVDGELPEPVQDWPAWSVDERGRPNETHVFVLTSRQYATPQEAERELYQQVERELKRDFHRIYGNQGRWTIPAHLVQRAIHRRHVEPIIHTTGNVDFEVYRMHLQVMLDPPLRDQLYQAWREQISGRRLWTLGSLLGFATLLIGTCAAYLRLDLLTQGNYRRRLKFASLALIAAGGLAAAGLMPMG